MKLNCVNFFLALIGQTLSVLFSRFILAILVHVMEYAKGMCAQVQKHTWVLQLSMDEPHTSGYSLNADPISSTLPNFT